MNIYFARSLRGQHKADDRVVYQAIIDAIKAAGHTPTLETPPFNGDTWVRCSPEEYIYKRDIAWLKNSKALIAEVSSPSHGVGYEIAYAKHVCKIPTLMLAQKDEKVSAMLSGDSQGITLVYYTDTSDLAIHVKAFLSWAAS